MQNSVAKKIFAVGVAASTVLMSLAPFAAHAAAHALGTNIKSQDGTVWTITTENNATVRRPYTSGGAFISYGFNSWGSVVDANADDLALTAGSFIPPQDGKIICSDRGADKGTCYLITGGQKAGFTSAAVFTGLGFSFARAGFGDVSWMTSTSNIDNTTAAHRAGVLVNKAGTVYLVGANGLLGIPSPETFNTWGYSFADVVTANAADAAMTQTGVMAARQPGQFSPSALTNLPTSGNVSVSLASDTPAAGTVVAGQSIADLAHFAFSGNGTVTQVVLRRIGVSQDNTLSGVYLYNGNTRLTDAGSVSNGTVTFSNASGLFTVNGAMTVSVKSDIKLLTAGQTLGVQLASYTVANGSPASVSISGNTMSVATADLASAQVTATSTVSSQITAGTSNATLWGMTVNVGTRNVVMKYLALKQVGSIPADALQNLKLYVAGAPVGSTVSVDTAGNVVFDLSGNPVTLQTGNQAIEVHGDVVKGSSRNFSLQLQSASDIVLADTNFGVNVALTFATNFGFPVTPGTTTISQGSLSVQSDPSFSATQFVKNASAVSLGSWTAKAYGEDVKVNNLQVKLTYTGTPTSTTEGFNNLSLYVNGAMVGSSQSALSNGTDAVYTYTFGTTNLFTIPAGQTVTIAVKGDNTLTSNTSVTGVRADLVVPATALQGVTSYNTLTSGTGTYTGTALSIVSSSATLSKNTGVTNSVVSSNSINQKIGSYVIQATNAEGVQVTSLTVGLNFTGPMGTGYMSNLYVKTPNGQTTPVNPQATNNMAVDFTISASQTAVVDVYADINNATGTIATTMSGAGRGTSSQTSVNMGSVAGQTVTVGTGSLSTPTLQSSSPVAQFVIGGSNGQPMATYNFVATNGGVKLSELHFTIATGTGATEVPVTSVTVAGATAPVVGNTANVILSTPIEVGTAYAGVDVPVTVNFAPVGQNGIDSNQTVQLQLTYVKYLSGNQTKEMTPTVSSNVMDVVGSFPTLTLASSNNTLAAGNVTVGTLTIAANAAGNIIASTVPFTIASTTDVTADTISLVDGGITAGSASISGNAASVKLTTDNNIAAGSSKTYSIVVHVTSTGSANTPSLSVSMGGATGFLFKDVNGNQADIAGGTTNVTYIVNYPTNSATAK